MKFFKKVQNKKMQKKSVLKVNASKNTNGMGGGSIMEGKYFVYKKDPLV